MLETPMSSSDLHQGEVSPVMAQHPIALRFQCVFVVVILIADLGLIWIRPILMPRMEQYSISVSSALQSEPGLDREIVKRQFEEMHQSYVKLMWWSGAATGCSVIKLGCFLPFVATVFFATSPLQLYVRYLALFAISVPLVFGVYHSEVVEASVLLTWSCTMIYQYIVLAFAACVLAHNRVRNWRRTAMVLGCVPVVFWVVSVIEGYTHSLWIMFSSAIFATQVLLWGVTDYCRQCFRAIHLPIPEVQEEQNPVIPLMDPPGEALK